MVIEKNHVEKSLQRIRGLYKRHAKGELNPSGFATKARAELNTLYMSHTRELIDTTASRFTEEIRSFQTQFGLELDCSEAYLVKVNRGYRGIRASMYVRSKTYVFFPAFVEVFIGPFDEWDKIAIHTPQEQEKEKPSFYTKRRRKRWQSIEEFNFPDLLQRLKEEAEKQKPEGFEDDEVAF